MSADTDAGENGRTPIVVDCYVPAVPDLVFEAWTDPDIVMKWFGHAPNSLHSAVVDLRPGGTWRFLVSQDRAKSVGFEGEYIDVRPGERLVFTWSRVIDHADGTHEAMLHAEIEVHFTARGDGTDVRVIHTVKRPEDPREGIGDNWVRAFVGLVALFGGPESD